MEDVILRNVQFYKGPQTRGIPLSPFFVSLVNGKASTFLSMCGGMQSDSNIDTIVNVLECFYRASGLHINMNKSKLLGISIDRDKVDQAATKIGCVTLRTPFSYLGSKVGGQMHRIQSWNEIVNSMVALLSKWKMKTLSIGGGLGVSSLYALNRALTFKWVWRFLTQSSSLWARVIKEIHGDDGKNVPLLVFGALCKAVTINSANIEVLLDINRLRRMQSSLSSVVKRFCDTSFAPD
ncbi:hypothetical protein Tco_0363150 [Tanacetum coccineum]